jgi:hypothetical protein
MQQRSFQHVRVSVSLIFLIHGAGVEPIALQAYFGSGFHHPHLRGTTVHDWPLNVFSDKDAASQLSVLRAIASSDLHNLVYQADYRIVPAVNRSANS